MHVKRYPVVRTVKGKSRIYWVTDLTNVKVRPHDPNDKTVGECINQMESAIKLTNTINASPNNFRGIMG